MKHSPIRRAVVLGAGTMGRGIAAHLANAGIPSTLLDVVPKELNAAEQAQGLTLKDRAVRDRFAAAGKAQALKDKPESLFHPRYADLIRVGNLEDDLACVGEADWVVEVVVERMDVKRALFEQVEKHWKPGVIVSSNTSGLSLAGMIEGRSAAFKKHFLVTHFFNPVRYMKLLEIVAGPETDPAIADRMARFGEDALGKGVVFCKDTPNFVGNRIGVFGISWVMHAMVQDGLSIEEVDKICGDPMGRPKSAVFGTADIVGLDVLMHVAQNCWDNLKKDERRDVFKAPEFVTKLAAKGAFGRKSGAGFYKKVGNDIHVLDLKTGDYRPQEKVRIDSLGAAKNVADPGERLKGLVWADDKAGKFAWKVLSHALVYAATRVGEISDDLAAIDNAMKWGFNWEMGPFESWDAIGVKESVARMEKDGLAVPAWVKDVARNGQGFYTAATASDSRRVHEVSSKKRVPVASPARSLSLSALRLSSKVVEENLGATLFDLGDGIAGLEFHTKMNAIDDDIVQMMHKAVDRAEREFAGLVIANEGEHYSAGANLLLIWMQAQQKEWAPIAHMVNRFQAANQRMKYAAVPVVAAPAGLALGGGAEVCLGAQRVHALSETYIGLVELGVGVIPAGGGCKEMVWRALEPTADNPNLDPFALLRKAFETVAMAKVATSAVQAQSLGYLKNSDTVGLSRDRLIYEAKALCKGLADAGHVPAVPRKLSLPGRDAFATLKMSLQSMRAAHQISEHDQLVGEKLAWIMTGGDVKPSTPVGEQHLLDLEKEAFLSLCGEEKSQARMQYMLQNNKPLRN